MAKSVFLINGPNLNLLGTREPHIYGSTTLAEITSEDTAQAKSLGINLAAFPAEP